MPVSMLHSCSFVEKQKRRKCLAFICFCFVWFSFCQVLFSFTLSYAMKPFTLSVSLHPYLLPLFSQVMNIMIVLPRLMIILQCEDHCSNNPRCSYDWCVHSKFEMSYLSSALLPWWGNRHRLLFFGRSVITSSLFLAPIFFFWHIWYVPWYICIEYICQCITVIFLGDLHSANTKADFSSLFHISLHACEPVWERRATVSRNVDSNMGMDCYYQTQFINPTLYKV